MGFSASLVSPRAPRPAGGFPGATEHRACRVAGGRRPPAGTQHHRRDAGRPLGDRRRCGLRRWSRSAPRSGWWWTVTWTRRAKSASRAPGDRPRGVAPDERATALRPAPSRGPHGAATGHRLRAGRAERPGRAGSRRPGGAPTRLGPELPHAVDGPAAGAAAGWGVCGDRTVMSARWWAFPGTTAPPFTRDLPAAHRWAAPSHREWAARLVAVVADRAFAVLTGDAGVGKITALRAAWETWRPTCTFRSPGGVR